jgi:hypothetical protein
MDPRSPGFEQFDLIFVQAKTSLGLIPRAYSIDGNFSYDTQTTQWEKFASYIHYLNRASVPKNKYKVLFLARHGEGYHNVASKFYGGDCWRVCSKTDFYCTALKEKLTQAVLLVAEGWK